MLRILPTGTQSCSDSQDPERCAFIPSVGCTILYPGALSLYAGSIARSRHLVTFPPFFCTTTHPANNQDQSLLSFCVGVLIGKRSCESKSPLVNLVSSSLVIQRSLCLGLRFVTQQWMTAFEQGVDALMHTVGTTTRTTAHSRKHNAHSSETAGCNAPHQLDNQQWHTAHIPKMMQVYLPSNL